MEVIDTECRDKVKLVLTVGNRNELEAELAGVGWDDVLSDATNWDGEDEN